MFTDDCLKRLIFFYLPVELLNHIQEFLPIDMQCRKDRIALPGGAKVKLPGNDFELIGSPHVASNRRWK